MCSNMCCGIIGDELLVRVGREGYAAALDRPHAHEMKFTGRAMSGFVLVAPNGLEGEDLERWVRRGVEFAETLPAK